MSGINPKTGQPWANIEEMQAYINELEATKNHGNKNNKEPEIRITLDTGEVQLRRVTPNAITFPAETWLKIFSLAPKVSDCIKRYRPMLSASEDTVADGDMKRGLRQKELADGNPIIRKPKVTKVQTA